MRHAHAPFGQPAPTFRKPDAEDGAAIWELIRSCPPLDQNSLYCNLVQCDHFRDTCVLAELNGRAVGWVSGYLLPYDPETLFVWQVAVAEEARGMGLGRRMLSSLLARRELDGVKRLQTTITSANAASWALFRSFAERFGDGFDSDPHFIRSQHFRDRHDTEHMVTIALRTPLRAAA
jgi:L-2,4-diaminobutyric acid acetyltransferase